jgi:hypothetical protein
MERSEGKKLVEVTKETFSVSLESIRNEIVSFETRIREYLEKIGAEVEEYKFSVDKRPEGVEVEVRFKAHVRPRTSPSELRSSV